MRPEYLPADVRAAHWASRVSAKCRSVLRSGGTPTEIAWALGTMTGNVRTLSRRGGRGLNLTLPGWLLKPLGWKSGQRVVLDPVFPRASFRFFVRALWILFRELVSRRGVVVVREASERELAKLLPPEATGPLARE